MIDEPTVFVLGAGASSPYGYPTGRELGKEIISKFVRDCEIYFQSDFVNALEMPKDRLLKKARSFVVTFDGSHTESIDLFLAGHAKDKEISFLGRLAIVFRIWRAESKRIMFGGGIAEPEKDWYTFILTKLRGGLLNKEDFITRFGENRISIITFNYDRSLEHFLFESLWKCFSSVTPEDVKKQLGHIKIIHVFEQIAALQWQDPNNGIEYARPVREVDALRLARNLRIIYDENENPALEDARKLIAESRRIFFLGFGYAPENLELLEIPQSIRPNTKVYGTALGFTTKEIDNLKGFFVQKTIPDEEIGKNAARFDNAFRNLDCLMLLRETL